MSALPNAMSLLEAYEAEVRAWPDELTAIESLPDFRRETLLAWALSPAAPPGWRAEDVLCSRQMVLIGALAKAAEQAAQLGDSRTARQMAKLAHRTTLDLKGEAAMAIALGVDPDAGDA